MDPNLSKELLALDRQHIWHPFTPLRGANTPTLVTGAEGVYLHTADGRRLLDATSSWWVNLHGHRHPTIQQALQQQLQQMEHVIFADVTHPPAIHLAQQLLMHLPKGFAKIFYSDDGSTAVEVALKLALQHSHNLGKPKHKIVALEGGYHGDTFGAMSVATPSLFNAPFRECLFAVEYVPFPFEGREDNACWAFEKLLKKDDVAAFIYEPLVQGVSGMRMYAPAALDRLLGIARKKEVLCIADEVFTGFGRTGQLFASEAMRHKPDLIALSKGLTGGVLPLGATACSERLVRAFDHEEVEKTFFHGHSYTANPLACAAALASLKLTCSEETAAHWQRIHKRHQQFARRLQARDGVKEVRVLGTLLALTLPEYEQKYGGALKQKVYDFFLQRDILLRPLSNVLYIVPPYVITDTELSQIYEALESFIGEASP